ncbi:MAG: Fic family protein [Proteobacteria bacterium]|nr:Fic family protein [Pseudomonadota bacterium]
MTFYYQDVVDCNRDITGTGTLSASRRGQTRLSTYCEGGISSTIYNICHAAHSVVTNQYFQDGNHRTGVLLIYKILIRDALLVSRKRAYQLYAYLDEGFHRFQTGEQSNVEALCDFVGNGGFMKLTKRPELAQEYIGRTKAEVLAVEEVLKNVAKAPAKPREGVPFTTEMQQQLRAQNFELRAWREKRRIFMRIKGGTASHSSEQ